MTPSENSKSLGYRVPVRDPARRKSLSRIRSNLPAFLEHCSIHSGLIWIFILFPCCGFCHANSPLRRQSFPRPACLNQAKEAAALSRAERLTTVISFFANSTPLPSTSNISCQSDLPPDQPSLGLLVHLALSCFLSFQLTTKLILIYPLALSLSIPITLQASKPPS
jgi:hypothetical protein